MSVTVVNVDTGFTRTAITSSTGKFNFPRLPVGPYHLTAELNGFQTLQMDGLVMTVGAFQSLGDLTIKIATVEEVVNVTAQSPLVETGRSTVAMTFNQRAVENLPIRGVTSRTLR